MISLILGLGNIGERYRSTRHNVGFGVIESILKQRRLRLQPTTDLYDWAADDLGERRIVYAMPKTFMNLSGIAAEALLHETGLEPSEMLIVVDDFNLPLGSLRIRKGGSDGGHNGLESIIDQLQTEEFPRLRLGIGPVPEGADVIEFVLGKFNKEESERTEEMIKKASDAAMFCLDHSLEEAMSIYNGNPA
jgi:PTH1 family peptidyl-tRNA hydrolase